MVAYARLAARHAPAAFSKAVSLAVPTISTIGTALSAYGWAANNTGARTVGDVLSTVGTGMGLAHGGIQRLTGGRAAAAAAVLGRGVAAAQGRLSRTRMPYALRRRFVDRGYRMLQHIPRVGRPMPRALGRRRNFWTQRRHSGGYNRFLNRLIRANRPRRRRSG